jgi:hypothetical protein
LIINYLDARFLGMKISQLAIFLCITLFITLITPESISPTSSLTLTHKPIKPLYMIKTNSSRAVEAAADYIESLYQQGKSILLQTFNGQVCTGTISQQEVIKYNPLTVMLTIVENDTQEEQVFDLSDVVVIQPAA